MQSPYNDKMIKRLIFSLVFLGEYQEYVLNFKIRFENFKYGDKLCA